MANTIPFEKGNRDPEETPREQPPAEYTSEEVSEIIRVALHNAKGGEHATVNHEELLTIGAELGLKAADLSSALERIGTEREERDVLTLAVQAFRLHAALYAVVIAGLFLINWAADPSYWWFFFPMIGWGMLVAIHGVVTKYVPNLPVFIVKKAQGLSRELIESHRTPLVESERATFKIPDLLGGMAEANGLAHLDEDILTLEFETKMFSFFKSGFKEVHIPVSEIDAVRFEKKMFKTQLTMQARMMRTFRQIPGNTSGEIILVFDQNARAAAKQLANRLVQQIAEYRRTYS